MLENAEAEGPQSQRRQRGVEWTYEIFVEPLRLFHLEADSFDRGQLLGR